MSIALNLATLESLGSAIETPKYVHSDLSPGIVHVGVGNFHRAHQAWYLHQLFNLGVDLDWAIIGGGIKSYDQIMRDKLSAQNWLSTVVELNEDNIKAQICGSMIDFVDIQAQSLVERMSQASTRIVSLTITEGGYFIDPDSGLFDTEHAEIKADIAQPNDPSTVFGIIIKALENRRKNGIKPFTVLSCDNIPHNGDVTKNTLLGLAQAINPALATWIHENVTFPNSMVDCIAPFVDQAQIDRIEQKFGVQDNAPVVCESFRQWVLEDNFVAGRPELERVGVQFVQDVAPYELMKLRVLNGGHAALAYPAGLMGIQYAHEAMQNTTIVAYLNKLVTAEVIPSLPVIADVNVDDYFAIINQRFANPEIKDTIERLYQDGSNRLPKFILPTITSNIATNKSINGLSLVLALWCILCQKAGDQDGNIVIHDAQQALLTEAAIGAQSDPKTFIEKRDIFGNLAESKLLQSQFAKWLNYLHCDGVDATLIRYINE